MKKIISLTTALSVLITCSSLTAVAADDTPVPADVGEAVYAQLLKNKWECDQNTDGIITDEELAEASQLSLDLTDITDLSWLSKMKACRYLSFKNGHITDFSILKELPELDSLNMTNVPITNIDFMKDLNLEYCRFSDMDQITPQEKMKVIRFTPIEFWEGTAKAFTYYPNGFVDFEVTIDDGNIAVFSDGTTSSLHYGGNLYGKSAGKTTYTVSCDGEDYYTGEITVKESPGAYDPELHNTGIDNFEVGQSKYYNPDPKNGNRGLVTLVNGLLCSVRGNKVKIVETDVADYEHVYQRSYSESYNYADMVLKNDGTLLVNGEVITDIKVTDMRNGYFLGENGYIYTIVPKGEGFITATVTTDAKSFVDNCSPFYVTKDGHMKYYRTELTGDGEIRAVTGNTNIGEPVSSCCLGLICYVLDKGRTLYQVCYTDTLYKKKIDDNVTSLNLSDYESLIEYTKTDGTIVVTDNMHIGTNDPFIVPKRLDIEDGSFYIHEYQARGIKEDDAIFFYFITQDRTMSLSFLGDYCGLTNVKGEIGGTYDTEEDNGYVYFLRTDGSIWQYNLDTKQWNEALAGILPVEKENAKGDVNGDGELSVADIVLFQKWLLGVPDTHLADWKAGNLCDDDRLDTFDLCMMRKELLSETKTETK